MYCEEVTVAKLGGTINLSLNDVYLINKILCELHDNKLIEYYQRNSCYSHTTKSYNVKVYGISTFTILIDDAPTIIDPHSIYYLEINVDKYTL